MTDETMTGAGNTASEFTPRSYDVAPEDEHIASAILAESPLDTPGSGEVIGAVKFPAHIPLSSLPPELQEKVREKTRGALPDRAEEIERRAVMEVMQRHALSARIKTGLHENANGRLKEMATIAGEYRQLGQEWDRVTKQMTEVVRYDVVRNQDGSVKLKADGTPEQVAVYAMSAAEQVAAGQRLDQINYAMNLLMSEDGEHGPEGARRLQKALFEEVEKRKALAAKVAEDQEAWARAADINREARINERAKAYAKHLHGKDNFS